MKNIHILFIIACFIFVYIYKFYFILPDFIETKKNEYGEPIFDGKRNGYVFTTNNNITGYYKNIKNKK